MSVNEKESTETTASDSTLETSLPPGLRVLTGHTSQETAYVQPDYPYGRHRCQRRVWIETKPKQGQRFVAQTQDPKRLRWNAPHASTYSPIKVLVLDERPESDTYEHVLTYVLGNHATEPQIDAFIAKFGVALDSDYARNAIKFLRALARASAKIEFKLVPSDSPEAQQPNHSLRSFTQLVHQELAVLNAQS